MSGLPGKKIIINHYRIDNEHSNSYELWKKMGSPQSPTDKQISELEKAGQLQMIGSPERLDVKNGTAQINFSLPGQGVSLLKMSW